MIVAESPPVAYGSRTTFALGDSLNFMLVLVMFIIWQGADLPSKNRNGTWVVSFASKGLCQEPLKKTVFTRTRTVRGSSCSNSFSMRPRVRSFTQVLIGAGSIDASGKASDSK